MMLVILIDLRVLQPTIIDVALIAILNIFSLYVLKRVE